MRDNIYGMLVIEFPTQGNDEHVALVHSEVNINLIKTSGPKKKL